MKVFNIEQLNEWILSTTKNSRFTHTLTIPFAGIFFNSPTAMSPENAYSFIVYANEL